MLDITFIGPPLPTLTGEQPLVIETIGNSVDANAVTGPWDFQLPLS